MISTESRLETLVTPIPVENWRRLEDYLQQARMLKVKGDSMYNNGKYVEAHTAFKMFMNLVRDIKTHNSSNQQGYKKQMFQLNQDVPLIRNVTADCFRHINNAANSKPISNIIATGSQLKRIVVPQELIDQFIAFSFENTENNIETLGILAGIPTEIGFTIKGLILPKQTGASDTCECLDDETLFHSLERNK